MIKCKFLSIYGIVKSSIKILAIAIIANKLHCENIVIITATTIIIII